MEGFFIRVSRRWRLPFYLQNQRGFTIKRMALLLGWVQLYETVRKSQFFKHRGRQLLEKNKSKKYGTYVLFDEWVILYMLSIIEIMKWMTIRIRVSCWVLIFPRIGECVLGWRAPRQLPSRWKKHSEKGQSPWGQRGELPSAFSKPQLQKAK